MLARRFRIVSEFLIIVVGRLRNDLEFLINFMAWHLRNLYEFFKMMAARSQNSEDFLHVLAGRIRNSYEFFKMMAARSHNS
jgi:hypothetical protein